MKAAVWDVIAVFARNLVADLTASGAADAVGAIARG
jgi:hypothetical protein